MGAQECAGGGRYRGTKERRHVCLLVLWCANTEKADENAWDGQSLEANSFDESAGRDSNCQMWRRGALPLREALGAREEAEWWLSFEIRVCVPTSSLLACELFLELRP